MSLPDYDDKNFILRNDSVNNSDNDDHHYNNQNTGIDVHSNNLTSRFIIHGILSSLTNNDSLEIASKANDIISHNNNGISLLHQPEQASVLFILLSVILSSLVVCTFIGNLFVIIAILVDKNLQTAANLLVLSLAVADFMVACLVMPLGAYNDLYQGWFLGTKICEFWTSADVLCCTASILNLLAIAIDRYWAVTNVDYIYKRTRHRVSLMILCAWFVAAVVSLAPIFGWRDPAFEERVNHEHKCLVSQDLAYQIFATVSTFYLPLVLLLALYWRIFQVAKKRIHRKPGRNEAARSAQSLLASNKETNAGKLKDCAILKAQSKGSANLEQLRVVVVTKSSASDDATACNKPSNESTTTTAASSCSAKGADERHDPASGRVAGHHNNDSSGNKRARQKSVQVPARKANSVIARQARLWSWQRNGASNRCVSSPANCWFKRRKLHHHVDSSDNRTSFGGEGVKWDASQTPNCSLVYGQKFKLEEKNNMKIKSSSDINIRSDKMDDEQHDCDGSRLLENDKSDDDIVVVCVSVDGDGDNLPALTSNLAPARPISPSSSIVQDEKLLRNSISLKTSFVAPTRAQFKLNERPFDGATPADNLLQGAKLGRKESPRVALSPRPARATLTHPLSGALSPVASGTLKQARGRAGKLLVYACLSSKAPHQLQWNSPTITTNKAHASDNSICAQNNTLANANKLQYKQHHRLMCKLCGKRKNICLTTKTGDGNEIRQIDKSQQEEVAADTFDESPISNSTRQKIQNSRQDQESELDEKSCAAKRLVAPSGGVSKCATKPGENASAFRGKLEAGLLGRRGHRIRPQMEETNIEMGDIQFALNATRTARELYEEVERGCGHCCCCCNHTISIENTPAAAASGPSSTSQDSCKLPKMSLDGEPNDLVIWGPQIDHEQCCARYEYNLHASERHSVSTIDFGPPKDKPQKYPDPPTISHSNRLDKNRWTTSTDGPSCHAHETFSSSKEQAAEVISCGSSSSSSTRSIGSNTNSLQDSSCSRCKFECCLRHVGEQEPNCDRNNNTNSRDGDSSQSEIGGISLNDLAKKHQLEREVYSTSSSISREELTISTEFNGELDFDESSESSAFPVPAAVATNSKMSTDILGGQIASSSQCECHSSALMMINVSPDRPIMIETENRSKSFMSTASDVMRQVNGERPRASLALNLTSLAQDERGKMFVDNQRLANGFCATANQTRLIVDQRPVALPGSRRALLRRKFKALGRLVSFVQTSRLYRSSSCSSLDDDRHCCSQTSEHENNAAAGSKNKLIKINGQSKVDAERQLDVSSSSVGVSADQQKLCLETKSLDLIAPVHRKNINEPAGKDEEQFEAAAIANETLNQNNKTQINPNILVNCDLQQAAQAKTSAHLIQSKQTRKKEEDKEANKCEQMAKDAPQNNLRAPLRIRNNCATSAKTISGYTCTTTNNNPTSLNAIGAESNVAVVANQSSLTTPTTRTATSQFQPHQHNHLQQQQQQQHRSRRANAEIKREKKAAKTLAIITGVFVCCWLPFFLNAIIMPICGPTCTPSDLIMSILLWLGYLNSLLNPLIYTIFSPDFRRAFRRLLLFEKCT